MLERDADMNEAPDYEKMLSQMNLSNPFRSERCSKKPSAFEEFYKDKYFIEP